jgi:hypothetical protein
MSDVRGLFPLEPPRGGLERLRRAMERGAPEGPWLEFMPWATSACLLLAITVPMLVGHLQSSRTGAGTVDRIVASVREQEPEPWMLVSEGPGGVSVYLARPSSGDAIAE